MNKISLDAKWKKRALRAAAALFLVAVTLVNVFVPFRTMRPAYALPAREEGELRIFFLDVGQGDCSVVQFPNGEALVIDAGDGTWEHDNKLLSFFKALRAEKLTYVVTHADIDHSGGIADLVNTFGADAVYLPAIPSGTQNYRTLLSAVEKSGAAVKTAKRYSVIEAGEAYAVFLSPYSQGETDENDASSVLYLRYGELTALFAADISSAREEQLRMEYEIDQTLFDFGNFTVRLDDVDILKVSHHGSNTASSAEWLDLIRPEVSVLSCGRGNPYGHPSGGALARLSACGSEIYRTDELGDILLSARADGSYTVTWEK